MVSTIHNRPNWLGSEVGMVLKTATISSVSGTTVTENGRTIIKSGTLITDTALGKGLLYNDADVTDGAVIKSIMIRGSYIDSKLPATVAASATDLAAQGLYAIEYADTTIAYGEVTE
ncbi:MAG: hypothetical protein IKB02_05620 [Clostridia bacterium]|nr:hypothetical protein [Clostridia bacterium]